MNTASGATLAFLKLPTTLNTATSSVWVAGRPEECEPKPRVLLIDTQSSFCELLSLYLPQKGFELATVRTVQEARIFVEQEPLDALPAVIPRPLNSRREEAHKPARPPMLSAIG